MFTIKVIINPPHNIKKDNFYDLYIRISKIDISKTNKTFC